MSAFLNRISNCITLIGLFIIYILFPTVFFKMAGDKINALAGKIIGPIDLTFGFNPARTLQMVADYGEARSFYQWIEMSVDLIYPVVYAFFFAVALTMIYRKLLARPVRYLNLIPFIAMSFDFLENIAIVSMLRHYPEQSTLMATLCEIFKMMKWIAFALIIFLVIFGLMRMLVRRVKVQKN